MLSALNLTNFMLHKLHKPVNPVANLASDQKKLNKKWWSLCIQILTFLT